MIYALFWWAWKYEKLLREENSSAVHASFKSLQEPSAPPQILLKMLEIARKRKFWILSCKKDSMLKERLFFCKLFREFSPKFSANIKGYFPLSLFCHKSTKLCHIFKDLSFFNPNFRNCWWKFEDDIGYDMDHHS